MIDGHNSSRTSEIEAAWSSVAERGRIVLSNLDGTVRIDAPFVLACECRGLALETAIARVSLFAFVLTAIVTAIVAVGAAPWPMLSISLVWASAGVGARIFAARRRREHGRFVVDFEHERILHAPDRSSPRELALAKGTRVVVEKSTDATAPFWLVVETPARVRLRIARGRSDEVEPLLRTFRQYHLGVDRSVLDAWESAAAED